MGVNGPAAIIGEVGRSVQEQKGRAGLCDREVRVCSTPVTPALLEAIPNVSEGRDERRLDRFARTIAERGATLLDRTADRSHHRAVFTFAGAAPVVVDA